MLNSCSVPLILSSLSLSVDLSDLDVGDSLPSEILSRVILELTEVVVPGVFWGDDKLLSETI